MVSFGIVQSGIWNTEMLAEVQALLKRAEEEGLRTGLTGNVLKARIISHRPKIV